MVDEILDFLLKLGIEGIFPFLFQKWYHCVTERNDFVLDVGFDLLVRVIQQGY